MAPPMLAFTTDEVIRLTGFSSGELRILEEAGILAASYMIENPRLPHANYYSFRDAVGLRVLNILLRTLHVEHDELRRVGQYLSQNLDLPWASLKIRVNGQHVVLDDPEVDVQDSGNLSRHAFVELDLAEIARNTERESEKLRGREPEDVGSITRRRNVAHNAWVIAGTRIPTSAIWNFHEAGYTVEQIIVEYPQLYPDDVEKALAHERALKTAA